MYVQEEEHVHHQINVHVKQVLQEINVNHLFALENHQLIHLFALEEENVIHLTHVNVIKDSQENNVKHKLENQIYFACCVVLRKKLDAGNS